MASERESAVQFVCGKKIVEVDGAALREEASSFDRVVVDLGAGDGRFAYRLARAHPAWFCVSVDANADGMAERSYRAGRKASRGGITNVRFIRAAVERLPAALDGLADEITVLYPWGSLLKAVIRPHPELIGCIARLGKPGALLRVRINASAMSDGAIGAGLDTHMPTDGEMIARLLPAYAGAGIRIIARRADDPDEVQTSWGRRLHHGDARPVIALDGVVLSSIGRGAAARGPNWRRGWDSNPRGLAP